MMNIKERLTCQYCNQIYNKPTTLTCGHTVCKHHIDELISSNASITNKFLCPICSKEILNQDFTASETIQALIDIELHEFKLNQKYENLINSLKTEIRNLETIVRDPQNCIYEKISELKSKVDQDRETLKSEIDKLADGLIKALESCEAKLNSQIEANVDFDYYNYLVESSKRHLEEYEQCFSLFSVDKQRIKEKLKKTETFIETLRPKIKELKEILFANQSIKYKKTEIGVENMFGKLIIKVSIIIPF